MKEPRPIWEVFKAALGEAADVSKATVTAYLAFLKSAVKWSLVTPVVLLPLPVIGIVFHWSWMNGLYLLAVGAVWFVLLAAAWPVIMLARIGYEHVKPYRKMAQLRAGAAFWGLLIVMYFWFVPIWDYPKAIGPILMFWLFLGVAYVRFGYSLNPKFFFHLMTGVFLLVTLACCMPASRSAAGAFMGWLDNAVANRLENPFQQGPRKPQRIQYSLATIDSLDFFEPLTGEPKVWYYAAEDGRIQFFDSDGYHPQYREPLKPITPEVVTQARTQAKADANEAAQAALRRQALPTIARDHGMELSELQGHVQRAQTAREPKPATIKPEDTEGQVQREKPPVVRPQERTIEPEETDGTVLRPRGR